MTCGCFPKKACKAEQLTTFRPTEAWNVLCRATESGSMPLERSFICPEAEGSFVFPNICIYRYPSARGRRAFLQRKNGRRGVAEHFHSEKMAGEGSRSISTTKKWAARGRGAFLQRKNGRRGGAEHFHSEKMVCGRSRSISTAKFSFRSFNRPFRVCFFYITAQSRRSC